MKLIIKNVAFGLALVGLASCANEAPWGNGIRGKGGVTLKLTADAEVKDALPSVRAEAPALIAPDAADFSIEMKNHDTEQVQTWRTLEEFNSHDGFDVGSYTLTATYGNIDDCGFDKPFFTGNAEVHVLEGRESSVEVTTVLGNSMLSVDYTDAFRGYFSDYSVTAHTDGHANVVFGRSETRVGFLTPGDITLEVKLTNPSGKTGVITAAEFPAVARHHYHVTFDVNADPMGNSALEVNFDSSLTQYNVVFKLIEELYNAEAPVVAAEGFTSGLTFESLSGNVAPSPLKFETVCKGGLKNAVLKIAPTNGTVYEPPFAKELDLMEADESTQYQLEQNGIKVHGIFKNPEQMAIVDVTELPSHLPEGTYEITFTVTDKAGRNNETPVVLNLATLPIHVEATGGSAHYAFAGKTATPKPTIDANVTVNYNGLNPEKCISFKNKCHFGGYKDCEIVSVTESTRTRGFPDKTYIFNIKVCDTENSPLPMQLYFNGEKRSEFTISVIEPEYSLQADPFATYARFKVDCPNAEEIPTITNGLYIYNDGTLDETEGKYKNGEVASVTTDPASGIVTLVGLEPDKDYIIGYSLTMPTGDLPASQTVKFHTEKDVKLENGDFQNRHQTINQNMQVGGVYRCGSIDYTNWSQVSVYEPIGWGSINSETFNLNSKTVNSWFTVVSTYLNSEGQAVIRSVGYDHNGTLPSRTGSFTSTTHYNTNTPTISSKVAGELFFDPGIPTKSEDIMYGSRPSSISFDCSYVPYGTDTGYAKVEVLDASGKVIATGSRNINSSSVHTELIPLNGYPFGSKAASIRIQFKSSSGEFSVAIPNPNVDSWSGTLPITPYHHNLGENNYHSFASGSVLTIDNVKLNY